MPNRRGVGINTGWVLENYSKFNKCGRKEVGINGCWKILENLIAGVGGESFL